ncbi:MAG: DNA polymerase III subunit [Pirellulales bacterium]
MWQGIIGHDEIVEHFRRTLAAGRLASTYLFVGPPGVGKKKFALELAHALLCTETPEASLAPCGQCASCRMFAAGNHPDLEVLGLLADASELKIEQFLGKDEKRNQDGMCHNISLKPFFGKRKVAIVDDADLFNNSSANCLLKTLEEPPPSALMILIGTSPSRQLPTIRSRAQVVRFRTLAADVIADILLETGAIADRGDALRVAQLSEGSIERAVQLADPALRDFRNQLCSMLDSARLDSVRLTRAIQSFVDEAGKETSLRRERLRVVIGFALEFYRARLHASTAAESGRAIHALDVSLQALEHIDRNANIGLVIQSWCEGLADTTRSGVVGLQRFATSSH